MEYVEETLPPLTTVFLEYSNYSKMILQVSKMLQDTASTESGEERPYQAWIREDDDNVRTTAPPQIHRSAAPAQLQIQCSSTSKGK